MQINDFTKFYAQYASDLCRAMASVNLVELKQAIDIILDSPSSDVVYVAGNGGSAAIANHLCCDFTKGTHPVRVIPTVSLMANPSVITAIGNDLGYDQTIEFQLKSVPTGSTVILISSSGNSPNIVKAAQYCKDSGLLLIGFSGFDGGKLSELSDISVHVKSDNYGVVEDCHQIIMHVVAQYMKGNSYD